MKFASAGNLLKEVLIAFILVAIVCPRGQVSASGAATIRVATPTQSVSPGTQFTVNITIAPNNAIAGAQFNLSFDPSLVSVDSVTEGNLFNQNGASTYFMPGTIDNSGGTLTGVVDLLLGSGQSVSNPGTFAVVTMTAGTKSGTSKLTLSNVIVGDVNAQTLSVTLINGQVVISSELTTTTTTTPTSTTKPTTTTTTTPTTTTKSIIDNGAGGGSGGGGGSVISGHHYHQRCYGCYQHR